MMEEIIKGGLLMNRINISFDIDLEDSEELLLRQILNLGEQDDLDIALEGYAKASLEEYIKMFYGQKVFTRGSDFKEYRLYLIIMNALSEKIPNEDFVSRLFQLTTTESRSLIRSVMSKFQYDLNTAIDNSVSETLQSVNQEENPYTFSCDKNMVAHLNRVLTGLNGTLEPIKQKSNTTSIYEIKPSSYLALAEKYDLQPTEVG
jgi:hypothetical protein